MWRTPASPHVLACRAAFSDVALGTILAGAPASPAKAGRRPRAAARAGQEREAYEALRKARLGEFMAGFNAVSLRLKEMYQMITLGGDAELELVDTLDPFSEVTP